MLPTYSNQRGHGMHLVGVSQHRRCKMRYAEADSPRGVTFKFNHLVRALHHLFMQPTPILLVFVGAHVLIQIAQTYPGNIDSRPDGD